MTHEFDLRQCAISEDRKAKTPIFPAPFTQEEAMSGAALVNMLMIHELKKKRTSVQNDPENPFDSLVGELNAAATRKNGGNVYIGESRIKLIRGMLKTYCEERKIEFDSDDVRECFSQLGTLENVLTRFGGGSIRKNITQDQDPIPSGKPGLLGRLLRRKQ